MMRKAFVICQLLAGVCLSGPCYAQAVSSGDVAGTSDAAAPQDDGSLGDIVVTAQRRDQSLQDIPIAVSAVTSGELQSRGLSDTRALQAAVPSLTLPENGVSVTPFLRGVGSSQSNPNDEPSVATYIDGVYIASPTGNIFSFNNIERIEVLKGPQGTLFGRNATGGVIQIVTRDPGATPTLSLDLGYGNYNRTELSGYASTPIGDNLAADVAVVYNHNFDGYGRDIFRNADIFEREEFAVRSKWAWRPGPDTQIRISGDYSKLRSTGTDYQLAQGVVGADGVTTYPGVRRTNTDFANRGDNEVYGGSVRVDHDFGGARLASISAYRHVTGRFDLDQDATPTPIVRANINQYAKQFSQELQLFAPANAKIDWLAGLYYFDASYAYTPLNIKGFAAAPFTSIDLFGSQGTKSYSAYGQITFPLGSSTHLTGGLRYTHENQDTNGRTESNGVVIVPNQPQSQSFDRLTWRASLDHQFSEGVLGYVSYNRGIKSGGFNMINAGTPGYKPEVLDAYEVGLKTDLAGRTVRINTAAFYYNYSNIQVFTIAGGGAVLTTNAASARLFGLDVDFAWRMTSNLRLNLGFGYINSEYTDFRNAAFIPASPLQGPQTLGNATGNQLVFAPKVSFNAALSYKLPTSVGIFSADANASFRDNVFVSADNRLQIPAYWLTNASVGWRSNDDHLGLRLWVRNLFDEDYFANRTEQNGLGDIQYLAPPRTFGATASLHF